MNRTEKITTIKDLLAGKKTLSQLGPFRAYSWICDNGECVSTHNTEGREIRLQESELKAFTNATGKGAKHFIVR
jgi:hypothetical protein